MSYKYRRLYYKVAKAWPFMAAKGEVILNSLSSIARFIILLEVSNFCRKYFNG